MINKELVAASSRALVLSILRDGESYGYEIIQRVKSLSNNQLNWTDGMLYPVLHRLENDGLIKSEWRTSTNGRRRKYYSLQAPGHRQLQEEQRQWLAVHDALTNIWRPHSR